MLVVLKFLFFGALGWKVWMAVMRGIRSAKFKGIFEED